MMPESLATITDKDGSLHSAMFVVDDFYPDPDEVRHFALSCDYRKPLISSTPALISSARHPLARESLLRIGDIAGVTPDWETVDDIYNFWGQAACGEFQLGLSHLSRTGQVHSHKNGEWVGIVYLSHPSDCEGRDGTYVVRHKELGIFRWHNISEGEYAILRKDAKDGEKWEILAVPKMKCNRLFLFDSRYFHAESPGFGADSATGRLIQIFNFKSVGTNAT